MKKTTTAFAAALTVLALASCTTSTSGDPAGAPPTAATESASATPDPAATSEPVATPTAGSTDQTQPPAEAGQQTSPGSAVDPQWTEAHNTPGLDPELSGALYALGEGQDWDFTGIWSEGQAWGVKMVDGAGAGFHARFDESNPAQWLRGGPPEQVDLPGFTAQRRQHGERGFYLQALADDASCGFSVTGFGPGGEDEAAAGEPIPTEIATFLQDTLIQRLADTCTART